MHKARHALCYTVYCEEFVLAIFAPSQILLCSIVRCVVGRFCTDPHTYIHTATLLLARLAVVRQCPSVRFFPVFKKKNRINRNRSVALLGFLYSAPRAMAQRSGPVAPATGPVDAPDALPRMLPTGFDELLQAG